MISGKNSLVTALLYMTLTAQSSTSGQKDYSKLWALIERIGSNIPLTRSSYETATRQVLYLQEADEYSTLWTTGPIPLQRNLGITQSSLSLDPEGNFGPRSGATIKITGACITVEDVKAIYGSLTIAHSPRGHSLEEALIYRSTRPWGALDFAFTEIAPDCLSSVVMSGHNSPE